jgi:predicted extracellular nuclease
MPSHRKSLLLFVTSIIWVLLCQSCSRGTPSLTLAAPEVDNNHHSSNSDLQIHDIQGASHNSPFDGEKVSNIPGIVTFCSEDGFYMQSQEPDSDSVTSEGIWVETTTKPDVNPGDLVSVTGVVDEYFPGGENGGGLSITQIKKANLITITSGNPLPTPVLIGKDGREPPTEIIEDDKFQIFDPESDGIDFYESLEGMLVVLNDAVAIAPTDNFGEIAVVVDNGENAGVKSVTCGLIIQQEDANPERILVDDTFVQSPSVKIGAKFPEITGIIDYSYGNFKFQPIERYQYEEGIPASNQITPANPGQLRIASYNVENLDANDSDDRFEKLADQIVKLLKSPDIIGVQEIQDNNGPYEDKIVDASQTWRKIVVAIIDAGGPVYEYRDINPLRNADGGEAGGNGRVGFLFRTDTGVEFIDRGEPDATTSVQVVNSTNGIQLSINPGRIQPSDVAFINSRKPLVGEFRYQGELFFIINLHLVSKGDDTPLFGSIQPPLEKSEFQRINQIRAINHFINELLGADSKANLIMLGDFNDFLWSDSLQAAIGSSLIDLVGTLPLEEQFTYIFEGNSQALDHMLITETVAKEILDYDIIHINTILPSIDRLSDHDPQLLTVSGFK